MNKVLTLVALVGLSAVVAQAQAADRPALGITMSDNSAGGVLVTTIVPGSSAARAGLQAGDRILSINGQPMANYRDVIKVIGATAVNAPVQLQIDRGGWKANLSTTLAAVQPVIQARPAVMPAAQSNAVPAGTYYGYSPADINDQHGFGE
jgi:S1-C subfamily serine protease